MSKYNRGSNIFAGFRSLGFVCNNVPHGMRYHARSKDHYVITAIGKAFHTYRVSKLAIVAVSDTHPEDITCLVADAFLAYTACKNVVRAFTLGQKVVHTYNGHTSDVHLLLPFGDHLVSIDADSNLKIWDIQSEELYLDLPFDNNIFRISALMHPATYLNKILLGSHQGGMQLWNIKSNKLLYTFQNLDSPITVIKQSPAVDVVAVGLANGKIILLNIKYDETIVTFTQDWGPVTDIAFRTDGNPIMVTGSTAGHLAIWNLEERRLQAQMRDVHAGAVAAVSFLTSEPILVTNGGDNTLKVWIFDQPDGSGRILRLRKGHSAPPTSIKYYGKMGKNILSAGQDGTLKSFSMVHDKHNKDLGVAAYDKAPGKKKDSKKGWKHMRPITCFAAETSRESDWDGIAACHQGTSMVTTWNYQKSNMGKHKIKHDRFKGVPGVQATVRAVDISSCGNFLAVGWSTGDADQYNIQSGIHRGTYGDPKAHNGAIRGLAINGLNQVVITGSADCQLKFWHFKKKNLLQSLEFSLPISQLLLHRESSMLAVVTDDFTIHVVDADLKRVVRRFSGHHNRVTDLAFSQDARWLITSSMDCTVRTWDLPTAKLIDCFLVDEAVTSVTLSPTNDFLATSHVDDLGIYLWSNKTLYSHVSIRPLPDDYVPTLISLPGTSAEKGQATGVDVEGGDEKMEEDDEEEEKEEEELMEFKSPDQIGEELITLSLLPNSRWQSLTHLDLIKKRNKPKQPPKAPKAAPFFLPTVAGLTPKFIASSDEQTDKPSSHVLNLSNMEMKSDLCVLLEKGASPEHYDAVLKFLKTMSPSRIDMEFRSLDPVGGGSVLAMRQFISFLHHSLTTGRDYELIQAYLALFLKLHGAMIARESDLAEELSSLAQIQESSWLRIQRHFDQSLCLVKYLKSAKI
ncbi:WD repeat-containing protein 36 [Strongylocentrotus purpuratus]|uniref:Small-subunit processome Utp21 domain-containing protein n=1 Tax=Strongylocentrotus purpuratus TaxID=7668 RepID=A0A7M7P062_STRPU|nr:WD repeat-containing protein 36 [Strongylocentrotus purpuratus]